MLGETHELAEEFPEYRELIAELRDKDSEFAKLFTEYHEVNQHIVDTEHGEEAHSDAYTEDMKKRRVLLKDQLFQRLQSATS